MLISSLGATSTSDEVIAAFGETGCSGKSFLVTGCSSGLGKELVRALSAAGGRKILAISRPNAIVERSGPTVENVVELPCDLASFESVQAMVANVLAYQVPQDLDCLILNAGVQVPCLQVVEERSDVAAAATCVELQMKTNHLGHFLLVHLLIPHLRPKVRVVVVSSDAHKLARDAKRLKLSERWSADNFHSLLAYSESKLANVLFALELNRRLERRGLLSVSVHPGVVLATKLGRHMVSSTSSNAKCTWPTKSIEQGAGAILFCALAPGELLVGGAYYSDCKESKCSKLGRNAALAAEFFDQSESICGLSPFEI